MAKTTHPLHSLSVSGTVGGALSFRATKSGSVCAKKPRPYPQQSAAMLANQQRMRDARTAFLTLNAADLNDWQALGTRYRRTAWASFFAEYNYQMTVAPALPLIPEAYL